jgi:hypothetical protein
MNDTLLLDWVSTYVTEIQSLKSPKGHRVQVTAQHVEKGQDFAEMATRSERTEPLAFRACVRALMKKLPPVKVRAAR